MSRRIKGVAFDLEGTVIDLESAHHRGHIAVAAEVAVFLSGVEEALKKIPHFIGGPDELIMEEIWNLSDKTRTKEYIAERDKYYYLMLLRELVIVPRDGFLLFVEKLNKLGIKIAIGSLTSREDALTLLNLSGLDKIFPRSCVVLREDVENFKPAPDVFLETARRMGIRPEEQLVFEDSPRGIMAACSAGSKGIGMPVYDLETVIKSLEEAGAECIYTNWADVNIEQFLY